MPSTVSAVATSQYLHSFLNEFAKFRKGTLDFVVYFCSSVRFSHEKLGFHWKDFHKILCL